MRIQYISDLHLEFPDNQRFIGENPIPAKGEILVIAGDFMPLRLVNELRAFLDRLSDQFRQVYWVPGNHEFYGGELKGYHGSFQENIRDNITLLNNSVVEEKGVKLIFSTLWSEVKPENQIHVMARLNDFRMIRYGDEPLTVDRYNQLHQQNREFLRESMLQLRDEPTFVVTHHVPTFYNYPEDFRRDPLNNAYASELEAIIADGKPNYWQFGHHHHNLREFKLHDTQFLINQVGTVANGGGAGFEPGKRVCYEL